MDGNDIMNTCAHMHLVKALSFHWLAKMEVIEAKIAAKIGGNDDLMLDMLIDSMEIDSRSISECMTNYSEG